MYLGYFFGATANLGLLHFQFECLELFPPLALHCIVLLVSGLPPRILHVTAVNPVEKVEMNYLESFLGVWANAFVSPCSYFSVR